MTQTLRVPVKITLKQLQCWVESDLTSIVYGDDPYLYITGTHTNTMTGKPWFVKRGFSSDVEAGGILDINLPIFDDSDPERRALTFGEALGVQFSLYEEDATVDDEIDFGYPIIDYTFAVNNQNKTLERVEKLGGDGAIYYLTYRIEIGAAQQDLRRGITGTHKFRAVDAKLFAGSFVGTIGDQPGELALSHLASFDPAYPNGAAHGSLKDGGVTASVRTQRLQGDSLELVVKYPSGSLGS